MLRIMFLVSLESTWWGGVHVLGSMTFGLAVQKLFEYWMISSLKIKLNCSWKFQGNWNVPLMLLERTWWAGFNGICFVRFVFRMGEILIFKWFLPLKIQINSRKTRFGKQISWGCGNTWANSTGHTSTSWELDLPKSENWLPSCWLLEPKF